MLDRFQVIGSRDTEFTRDRLFSVYGARRFKPTREGFSVRASHAELKSLALSYCDYSSETEVEFPEADFVRQVFHIRGRARSAAGNTTANISASLWSHIIPAHVPFALTTSPQYQQLVLRLNHASLTRALRGLLGDASNANLDFSDEVDCESPLQQSLRRQTFQFAHEYNQVGSSFSPLAIAEFENMLTTNFVLYNRHQYSHLFVRHPKPVSDAAVRIVEEYIEQNWDKPICVDVLASVANASARSLFRQFRNARGYSPLAFAKLVRLQRAKAVLQDSNDDTSVLAVALRCGFNNAGHFSRDYRETFGELPSATLRKSRGPRSGGDSMRMAPADALPYSGQM